MILGTIICFLMVILAFGSLYSLIVKIENEYETLEKEYTDLKCLYKLTKDNYKDLEKDYNSLNEKYNLLKRTQEKR